MLHTTDLTGAKFVKSSYSGGNGGNCVEVATNLPDVVAVRHSKHPDAGTIVYTDSEWTAFLAGARDGEFDK